MGDPSPVEGSAKPVRARGTLRTTRRDVDALPQTVEPAQWAEAGAAAIAHAGVRIRVPFYRQSLDFSCGPACLIMAMRHHDPSTEASRAHEIDLWREANLVELGATSRYGLALGAHRRGFRVRIVGSSDDIAYRTAITRTLPVDESIMDVFFDDVRAKCRDARIPEEIRRLTMADLEQALAAGEVPIVLTDTRLFSPGEEVPHWVIVSGLVGDTVFVTNPLDDAAETPESIPVERFLAAFGYDGDQLMVAVGPRS